jgi:hypothetical protein
MAASKRKFKEIASWPEANSNHTEPIKPTLPNQNQIQSPHVGVRDYPRRRVAVAVGLDLDAYLAEVNVDSVNFAVSERRGVMPASLRVVSVPNSTWNADTCQHHL